MAKRVRYIRGVSKPRKPTPISWDVNQHYNKSQLMAFEYAALESLYEARGLPPILHYKKETTRRTVMINRIRRHQDGHSIVTAVQNTRRPPARRFPEIAYSPLALEEMFPAQLADLAEQWGMNGRLTSDNKSTVIAWVLRRQQYHFNTRQAYTNVETDEPEIDIAEEDRIINEEAIARDMDNHPDEIFEHDANPHIRSGPFRPIDGMPSDESEGDPFDPDPEEEEQITHTFDRTIRNGDSFDAHVEHIDIPEEDIS